MRSPVATSKTQSPWRYVPYLPLALDQLSITSSGVHAFSPCLRFWLKRMDDCTRFCQADWICGIPIPTSNPGTLLRIPLFTNCLSWSGVHQRVGARMASEYGV